MIEFEKIFDDQFNMHLAKYGPQCYEQAVIKCRKLQKEDRFQDCPKVQKMKFCKDWWQKFQKDRGMRWIGCLNSKHNFKTFLNFGFLSLDILMIEKSLLQP